MRAVLQRVSEAQLFISTTCRASIGQGLLLFLAISSEDKSSLIEPFARKILKMRLFENSHGKMDLSLKDVEGDLLVVPQFTLYADTGQGNRPFFGAAAAPPLASQLYEQFVERCIDLYPGRIFSGVFGAFMQIKLVNEGPVTIILDSN